MCRIVAAQMATRPRCHEMRDSSHVHCKAG